MMTICKKSSITRFKFLTIGDISATLMNGRRVLGDYDEDARVVDDFKAVGNSEKWL